MGLSDKAKENKARYIMDYNKSHYKRIPLDISFDKYEEIKQAAGNKGEKINTYIKNAIDERLNRDNNNQE